MQSYDLFMLLVVAAAVIWGAWKGLAWQLASVASLVLSYFVSVNFRGQVAQFFHYEPPEFNNLLAMLVLYVGTTLVVWVGFNMVRDFLEKVQLKEFDRQIGGLLGLAKGLAICVLITLFTVGLGTESQRQAVIQSRSGYYITQFLKQVEPMVPAEYRRMVDDAIVRLEDRSGVPRGTYNTGSTFQLGWGSNATTTAGNNWSNSWNQPTTSYSNNSQSYGYGSNPNYAANPNSGMVPPDFAQQIQTEILSRLQQSSNDPNLYSAENIQRIQQEIQMRWQQAAGASGGGMPTRESLQQAFGEMLGRTMQSQTQPPSQPQTPPNYTPGQYQPGYGYGS
jgi:membrane protein required for colicin V production